MARWSRPALRGRTAPTGRVGKGGRGGHQALTGMGASRRQRTAADLAGHDRGPPIAVSAVLLGRPPPGVGPVLEAGGGRTAPLLEVAAA